MCPSKKGEGAGARRQLTYQDRVDIEAGLNRGDRLSTIARTIGRAPKVVAAEVRRNWTDVALRQEQALWSDIPPDLA